MSDTHLRGLEGTNPLAFLAALGVLVAIRERSGRARLWWSDDVTPHAVVDAAFSLDSIADAAVAAFDEWKRGPAANPVRFDGTAMSKGDELKLKPEDIRTYLDNARGGGSSRALATALVAEGALDNKGVAKPSLLYFTAGQQKFLQMARQILDQTSRADVVAGLKGDWSYDSKLPSLMWDVSDDRTYALAAYNPSSQKKLTNPGPEALALLGLSLHPVFAASRGVLTQGCVGAWKSASYSWPLWGKPTALPAVKSLLAHASIHPPAGDRQLWFRAWGVFTILQTPIRRSGQGGYGTFGPPMTTWRASRTT